MSLCVYAFNLDLGYCVIYYRGLGGQCALYRATGVRRLKNSTMVAHFVINQDIQDLHMCTLEGLT
jgi:hypothetical protein